LRHDILRALVVNLAHFMSRDLRYAGLRYVLRSHGVAVGNDLEARRERPEMFTAAASVLKPTIPRVRP